MFEYINVVELVIENYVGKKTYLNELCIIFYFGNIYILCLVIIKVSISALWAYIM